jgi:LPXTG-site transpeptidase (sortase) family protein
MKKFFDPKYQKSIEPKKGKEQLIFYNPNKRRTFIFGVGTGSVILCLFYLGYLWLPLARATLNYHLQGVRGFHLVGDTASPRRSNDVTPTQTPTPMPTPKVPDDWLVASKEFSIYIPRLESSAKVFANVNPGNPEIYQEVLKEGVAHAAGSGLPGGSKPVYLFAHSTNAEWNVVRYNAVFFLLNKLEPGDLFHLVYNNQPYTYQVFDKKVVGAKDVSYLTDYHPGREEAILQTCWPPGTIFKRLLVVGKRI